MFETNVFSHNNTLPGSWQPEEILALSLVPRLKSVDLRNLAERYVNLEALLQDSPEELRKARIADETLFSAASPGGVRENLMQGALAQIELCKAANVRILSYWDEEYPVLLKEIFYPPTLLYVRGNLQSPDAAAVAIVGTRNCTDYGKMVAEQYAEHFAHAGIVVVSGLATGVDTFAHKAAVKNGGVTYAVIACGIDKINTGSSAVLGQEISKRGAVLSEYPCGTPAMPAHFPRRNRIISGIAQGTLVVQSGEKGGSLITAQFTIDQNRELFAVPGPIYSERSRGTNLLLQRSQAHLTLSPHDLLQALGLARDNATRKPSTEALPELEKIEKAILNELSDEPRHIEALATQTKLPVQDLLVLLLQLEFKGYVRQLAGKQFMRRPI